MFRPAFILATFLVAALAAVLVAVPAVPCEPHNDFIQYWAAGRLNLARDNPYDPTRMLAVEQEAGWRLPFPMMMWNPPWTLALVMPFGVLPFPLARGLWMLCQLGISLGCAIALWRHYLGRREGEWIAVLLAALSVPLLLSLNYGQVGPLVLLGTTGFLHSVARGRDWIAGAWLVLASIKPHLVYAIWPALLVWCFWSGRWRVLAGLAAGGLVLAIIPAAVNPAVYEQYHQVTTNPPPSGEGFRDVRDWGSPTFGWQLRQLIGKEFFRLQFVPTVAGLVWLAWYLRRKRAHWDWTKEMPVLLLVSISTAAYGAWPADSLLLMPALIAAATRLSAVAGVNRVRIAIAAYSALNLLTFVIERGPTSEPYVWIPPLYLGLYLWLDLSSQNRNPGSPRSVRTTGIQSAPAESPPQPSSSAAASSSAFDSSTGSAERPSPKISSSGLATKIEL